MHLRTTLKPIALSVVLFPVVLSLFFVGGIFAWKQGEGIVEPANANSIWPIGVSQCRGASKDNNIWWSGVEHNSFKSQYRLPFGAVPSDSGNIQLRLRTCADDVESVRLTYWDSRASERRWMNLRPELQSWEPEIGDVQYWTVDVPSSNEANILYYFFELRDGNDVDYYVDDDIKSFPGGLGLVSDNWDDSRSFQISIYQKDFLVPEWVQGALFYQIFPDRFRNGDSSNDPQTNENWIYGQKTILNDWSAPLCDPLSPSCRDQKYNQFYGGDLKGIEEKLDYLSGLGVTGLYLNPIFESPTNHKYDTTNFKKVDPAFGTTKDFQSLVQSAKQRGMHLVLDGVFNHASADSPYFDLWGRWNSNFELESKDGPGRNDASGACESANSPWRSWFFIPDRGSPAVARDRYTRVYCPNPGLAGSQAPFQTYEAWFNFFNVPKINTQLKTVRDFFVENEDSVTNYWTKLGGAGWRLDVAGDIDPGWTRDGSNDYWERFRSVVKSANPEAWIIGEEWGNASPWLLGPEWDSVMNYRFRTAVMNWMFDSCRGRGCFGRYFTENDSNDGTHLGPIFPVTEAQFQTQLDGVRESMPPQVWNSAYNLLGSHDTNRILFLLKKISNEDSQVARSKLKLLKAFMLMYPGAPAIYYGDEVGVAAPGVWSGSTWQDDPYNRVAYPWADQGMNPDVEMREWTKGLGQLRKNSPALRVGGFEWLQAAEGGRVVAFERRLAAERIVAVFSRSNSVQDVEITGLKGVSEAAEFEEIWPSTGLAHRSVGNSLTFSDVEPYGVRVIRLKKP